MEEVVKCVLQTRRDTPVVLRRDEDEGRVAGDESGPRLAVGVFVVRGWVCRGVVYWQVWFVVEREVLRCEVQDAECDVSWVGVDRGGWGVCVWGCG